MDYQLPSSVFLEEGNSSNSTAQNLIPLSLILQPLDAPGLVLVSQVLEGAANYIPWRRSMEIALTCKNKLDFINISIPQPIEVIANRFCKMLCLKMAPEVSCFVRAVEVGGFTDHVEVRRKCSVQLDTLESEHKIYAYLGFRLVSPRFLKELNSEPIAISNSAEVMENMLQNLVVSNMFISFSSSQRQLLLTYKLITDLCVVHEIIVPQIIDITSSSIMYKPRTLRFRLGHLRDENANREESPEQNYNWTYVSTKFLLAQTDNVQSIKLPRPIICIGGLLEIEFSSCPTDVLLFQSISKIEAIGCSLAPTLDVSGIGTGNLVLLYFPGLVDERQRSSYSRSKFIRGLKRRRNRR